MYKNISLLSLLSLMLVTGTIHSSERSLEKIRQRREKAALEEEKVAQRLREKLDKQVRLRKEEAEAAERTLKRLEKELTIDSW